MIRPENYKSRSAIVDLTDPSYRTDLTDDKSERLCAEQFLCGYAERATPVPIPNTEVKPLRADGTALVTVWESRSPQGI